MKKKESAKHCEAFKDVVELMFQYAPETGEGCVCVCVHACEWEILFPTPLDFLKYILLEV